MSMTIADRRATTAQPIEDILAMRWSPRSFDRTAELTDAQITSLLEAARWASSAANRQHRRFIVGRRGSATFDAIVANLRGANPSWAPNASALIVAIAVTADETGAPSRWADYDLGQSMANLAAQAHAIGLHVHPMGGLDAAGLQRAFDLPEHFAPVTVTAVGTVADADLLPERLRDRERAERERLPLDELVLIDD
jgi:nitroreductase